MNEIKDLAALKQQEEKPVKKGLKRWHYIAIAVVLVLLIVGIGLTVLVNKIYAQASQTPLPPAPALEAEVQKEDASKTERYHTELRTQNRTEREAWEASQGMDRIRMSWDAIYGDPEEAPVVASAPKEAPKARSRGRVYRPPQVEKEVKRDTIIVQKQPTFNLKKGSGKYFASEKRPAVVNRRDFVSAVVSGDQKVTAGQPVRLRSLQQIKMSSYTIPKNSRMTGICNFGGGRVQISINQVLVNGKIIPVNFACYDQDLVKGIAYDDPRLERQFKRQVAREAGNGIDNAMRSVPYVGGIVQPVVRAIEQSMNGRTISVSLTNNYRVLLKAETR